MPLGAEDFYCRRFEANIFDDSRCLNCLRPRSLHPEAKQLEASNSSVVIHDEDVQSEDIHHHDAEVRLCILTPDCDLYLCTGSEEAESSPDWGVNTNEKDLSSPVSPPSPDMTKLNSSIRTSLGNSRTSTWLEEARGSTTMIHNKGSMHQGGGHTEGWKRSRVESGYLSLERNQRQALPRETSGILQTRNLESLSYHHSDNKNHIPFRNPDLRVYSGPRTSDREQPLTYKPAETKNSFHPQQTHALERQSLDLVSQSSHKDAGSKYMSNHKAMESKSSSLHRSTEIGSLSFQHGIKTGRSSLRQTNETSSTRQRTEVGSAFLDRSTESVSSSFRRNVESESTSLRRNIDLGSSSLHRKFEMGHSSLHRNIETGSSSLHRNTETGRPSLRRNIETGSPSLHRNIETGSSSLHRNTETGRPSLRRNIETESSSLHRNIETGNSFAHRQEHSTSHRRFDSGSSSSYRDGRSKNLDSRNAAPLQYKTTDYSSSRHPSRSSSPRRGTDSRSSSPRRGLEQRSALSRSPSPLRGSCARLSSSQSSLESESSWVSTGSALARRDYTLLADLPKAKRISHREVLGKEKRDLGNKSRTRSPGREEVERLFGYERRAADLVEVFESLDSGIPPRRTDRSWSISGSERLTRTHSTSSLSQQRMRSPSREREREREDISSWRSNLYPTQPTSYKESRNPFSDDNPAWKSNAESRRQTTTTKESRNTFSDDSPAWKSNESRRQRTATKFEETHRKSEMAVDGYSYRSQMEHIPHHVMEGLRSAVTSSQVQKTYQKNERDFDTHAYRRETEAINIIDKKDEHKDVNFAEEWDWRRHSSKKDTGNEYVYRSQTELDQSQVIKDKDMQVKRIGDDKLVRVCTSKNGQSP
ncbi:serine/arginine repetitive matrix protein 2-like [Polypterus senegalus]|uniref:serine/arginine repetitive matrix protein 2-like n=1 Tax=Polypterus senegalus TaxID=55291 RepID=UPI0019656D12|nr:serine/arginine repetitive matrix protein 2-like [Polypterus senegalus]